MSSAIHTIQHPQSSIINSPRDQLRAQNPRKAATKVKEVNFKIDIMKKRFLVMQEQEGYNRYKTLDHEKRIMKHNQIHQKIMKDKQGLKKSLEKISIITDVKEKVDLTRLQLRQKLILARRQLIEGKSDRTHIINQESLQHDAKIKENMLKISQDNKEKALIIQHNEQYTRQSVSRHINDKINRIKLNKSIDSGALARKAEHGQQELSRLMIYEQELIKKNSESLQASQLMQHKFNNVFTTVSARNSSRLLPEIRVRTNNSKNSNNSTEITMI